MRYSVVIFMGIILGACGVTALGPVGSVSLPGDASWNARASIEGDAPAWAESRERILLPGEETPERIEGAPPVASLASPMILPSDPDWNAPSPEPITVDTRRAELGAAPSL